MVMGLDRNGDIHIIDVIRGKYDFPELKKLCVTVNAKWRGKGLRGFYIEDKASGQSLIQELRNQSGISVIPFKVNARQSRKTKHCNASYRRRTSFLTKRCRMA